MEIQTDLLPCPLCRFSHFKDVHSLRSTLINVATSQLTCPVCNESVMGLDKLTIHLFTHVNVTVIQAEVPQEIIQFKQSEEKISNGVLIRNLSVPCDITPVAKDLLICDICNFTFTDQVILELHQKLLHQNNSEKQDEGHIFHCHLCSKKFKMKGSLIVHLRVAHIGFSSNNMAKKGKSDNNASICENAKDVKTVDNKQWECDVCSKMFTTKYFLKKHKRLHTGEMPYSCTQCNKSFTFQQSYHKHMQYHSSEKPHICTECGRCFKELSTLQNHARIHSGERPFGCETCGKRFRQRVSYLVHRRIHTGVMPYDCKNCGKQFRYKVSQRSHRCVSVSAEKSNENETANLTKHQNNESGVGENEVQCFVSVDNEGRVCFIKKIDQSAPEYSHAQDIENKSRGNKTQTEEPSRTSSQESNESVDDQIFESGNSTLDFYSMILSPALPDVESLCLSNSSKSSNQEINTNINNPQFLSESLFSQTNFLPRN